MIFRNTNTFFGRNNYLLIASAWLFTFSFIIDNYWSGTATTNAVQKAVQKNIIKQQRRVLDFYKDTTLLKKITGFTYNENQIDNLVEKNYYIFVYSPRSADNFSLIFWNTQIIEPDSATINGAEETSFRQLKNGWYVTQKKAYTGSNGSVYEIITLIPVKWSYYIENKYLQNTFIALDNIEKEYDISLAPTNAAVKDISGKKLFYITQIDNKIILYDNTLSIWLKILAGVLVLFFIHKLAKYYFEKKGFWPAFLILITSVLALRIASYFLPIPLNFHQLELFNPSVYGANFILPSLGDLLINSLLFIWIVLFIRFHFRFSYSSESFNTNAKKYFAVSIIAVLMISITLICGNIVRSLVSDSQISFDVINFFTINNSYSIAGFIVLSCVSTGYFFIIQILLQPIKSVIQAKGYLIYFIITILGLIFLSFKIHPSYVTFDLSLLMWLLLFIFLQSKDLLSLHAYDLISSRFVFWLFFFSVSITAAIVIQNRKKELEQRKHFAENLANKEDPGNQTMVNIILIDFNNYNLSQIFDRFKDPIESRAIKDSLINENFSGYLNKYDTQIYTFNSNDTPLYNEDSTNINSLNTIVQTQGKPTGTPGLFYYDVSYDRFNYISKKTITDSLGKKLGSIFIVSKPKKYKSDALYPELFSKGNANSIESSSIYAFAIYNKSQLSSSNNDYPFPTAIDPSTFTYNEFRTEYKNGYEELWYRANENKVIVIARQQNLFIEAITLFAYLFCSFLIIAVIFNVLSKVLGGKVAAGNLKSLWQFTIRNQVHGTIITISIFSFLVIGITTILFFISRYHINNHEKLSRTIHVMENEIRNSIDTMALTENEIKHFGPNANKKLEQTINRIAGIHAADINIYDLNGDLKVSSLPLPYVKGIVSEKMDPIAFFYLSKLKSVQFFQQQKIGSLDYLSNYVAVRDETGREYAYLNIPYFESQNNLQDEISNFLVTIINLNAFIFLIAGIIALFITNRITRSFSLISNRMKEVNLEKRNEEIVWTRQDEIGELVNEYNKMVKKLDVSAQLLAKSEREGAWREMARQVAHEIKNPLTPMKLNLQYLQMAIDNNSAEVKNISLYVANILLEQIEHLSQIASDFAQFANIGNSKNQLFDINRMLVNVASLYSRNEKLQIDTFLHPYEIIIEADKTQINRLFTNLLQNAVQAVPPTRKAIVEIRSQLRANKVVVSVKDNGNGIPSHMHNKIFTPNFTTKTSGTGLGLAMCKGIVEKLNGKIWFETKEEEWTIFYVELYVVED